MRLPGRGFAVETAGGGPGDLFVIVRTEPNPWFERLGTDLWRTEIIGLADAALGRKLVTLLDGSVVAKIAAGTQPDTVLRLGGKGFPQFDRVDQVFPSSTPTV